MNSFLDHDSPDYSVDGTITIANGITARSSDGQEGDFFPAYWSPALRQYINYDGHNGYDFGISYQPVFAAAAGTISYAGWNSPDPGAGYGQMVLIDHHNGYVTLYGHLSQLEVKTGDKVSAGQEIGISGTTGNSSGPHLHFSVFHNCQVTDPYGWTGSGSDPLKAFDGETASYLWLPGHDPLVLNPPPHWPAFPTGLRLAVAGQPATLSRSAPVRTAPPADRLLLLDLPLTERDHSLSPGVALARTLRQVSQEWQTLVPYLDDLRASGVLDSYQLVQSAGAVWIRGSAGAAQLEALPGVASLAGVQPGDVQNAQLGLAHAVVAQAGSQTVPSLWPVGFHSALHAWRPVIDVICGQPFVTGAALPGQSVRLGLLRGGRVLTRVDTSADPTNGDFVAYLASTSGAVAPRAGDVVEISTSGRALRLPVAGLTARARARMISGEASPGDTVQIAVLDRAGTSLWKTLVPARADGSYAVRPPSALTAGTMAVVGVLDAAGDQESMSAFTPGLMAQPGGETVEGWTVGANPHLTVIRRHSTLLSVPIHPASDGSFLVQLHTHGLPMALASGDIVELGSARHHHTLLLTASGASNSRAQVERSRVSVEGDIQESGAHLAALTVSLGSPSIAASVEAGAPVRIEVFSGGRMIAAATGAADSRGHFAATLGDWLSRPLSVQPGMIVSVLSPAHATIVRVPPLQARAGGVAGHLFLSGPAGRVAIRTEERGGKFLTTQLDLRSGAPRLVRVPGVTGRAGAVLISESVGPGLTVQRIVRSPAGARHRAR